MSVGRTKPRPPSSSTSRWAASSPARPRASRPMEAPWRAKACAVARPTPADAPVMTTTSACFLPFIGFSYIRDTGPNFVPQLRQSVCQCNVSCARIKIISSFARRWPCSRYSENADVADGFVVLRVLGELLEILGAFSSSPDPDYPAATSAREDRADVSCVSSQPYVAALETTLAELAGAARPFSLDNFPGTGGSPVVAGEPPAPRHESLPMNTASMIHRPELKICAAISDR